MGIVNFNTLRPFAEHKGLPSLQKPIKAINGKISKNGVFSSFQFSPSDHPSYANIDPKYDLDELRYTVNSNFFRADEFDKSSPGLMSLGCSHTYGTGLADNESWPHQLSQKLKLPNWNLGCGSTSSMYCLYVAKQFIEEGYIPKAVAVLWPNLHRTILIRDRFKITNRTVDDVIINMDTDLNEYAMNWLPGARQPNDEYDMLVKSTLARSHTQVFFDFLNIRETLMLLCKSKNIPLVEAFSAHHYLVNDPREDGLEMDFFEKLDSYSTSTVKRIPWLWAAPALHPYYKNIDWDERARDGVHCAAPASKALADDFYDLLQTNKL